MISETVATLADQLRPYQAAGEALPPATVRAICAVLTDIAAQVAALEATVVPPAARTVPRAGAVVSLDAARRRRRIAPVVGAPDPGSAA